jgi:prephenate dehydratase
MGPQAYRVSSAAMRIGYQGEPGAYSELAVDVLFPGDEPLPLRSVRAVFEALTGRSIDRAVVPLENSLAGSINETYDLLANGDTHIVGEVVVAVDHALLGLPGAKLEYIRRVESHPQALAQCDEYLAELDVEVVPVYDTAGAAKRLAEHGRRDEAAVASERAADVYGLEILARHIQTNPENQTRFVAIARESEPIGPADKTSLILITGHKPGALYHCLAPFAERDVNLSKLESRPVGHTPWKYRFFLDVDAGTQDPSLAAALEELHAEAAMVQVLGSYPGWRTDPASPA